MSRDSNYFRIKMYLYVHLVLPKAIVKCFAKQFVTLKNETTLNYYYRDLVNVHPYNEPSSGWLFCHQMKSCPRLLYWMDSIIWSFECPVAVKKIKSSVKGFAMEIAWSWGSLISYLLPPTLQWQMVNHPARTINNLLLFSCNSSQFHRRMEAKTWCTWSIYNLLYSSCQDWLRRKWRQNEVPRGIEVDGFSRVESSRCGLLSCIAPSWPLPWRLWKASSPLPWITFVIWAILSWLHSYLSLPRARIWYMWNAALLLFFWLHMLHMAREQMQ